MPEEGTETPPLVLGDPEAVDTCSRKKGCCRVLPGQCDGENVRSEPKHGLEQKGALERHTDLCGSQEKAGSNTRWIAGDRATLADLWVPSVDPRSAAPATSGNG